MKRVSDQTHSDALTAVGGELLGCWKSVGGRHVSWSQIQPAPIRNIPWNKNEKKLETINPCSVKGCWTEGFESGIRGSETIRIISFH